LTVDSDQGFHIEQLDTGYMQWHNPFAFMYEASRGPRIEPALACDPGRSIHLWLLKIQNRCESSRQPPFYRRECGLDVPANPREDGGLDAETGSTATVSATTQSGGCGDFL
jgi:hypothetical protein